MKVKNLFEQVSDEEILKWIVENEMNRKNLIHVSLRKIYNERKFETTKDFLKILTDEYSDLTGVLNFVERMSKFTINPDRTVSFNLGFGVIEVRSKNDSSEFVPPPFKFKRVVNFQVRGLNLKALPEWLPERLDHLSFFECGEISFHNIHKIIKECEDITLEDTEITDSILGICFVKGLKTIFLENPEKNERLNEIMNSFIPNGDPFDFQDTLANAGLDKFAKL